MYMVIDSGLPEQPIHRLRTAAGFADQVEAADALRNRSRHHVAAGCGSPLAALACSAD